MFQLNPPLPPPNYQFLTGKQSDYYTLLSAMFSLFSCAIKLTKESKSAAAFSPITMNNMDDSCTPIINY